MHSIYRFFLLLVWIIPVKAQEPIQFKHITKTDGLSSSSVNCILQDFQGFVWVGTYNGLNRYDGVNFKTYNHLQNNSKSISDDQIWDIFEDREGDIWVGTNEGLSLWDRKADAFINFYEDYTCPLSNEYDIINAIQQDTFGNIWAGGSNGLICFNREENSFVRYLNNPDDPKSISNNNIVDITLDKEHRLWISTWNGLNLFRLDSNNFKRFIENNGNSDYGGLTEIVADSEDDILWIGSNHSGLIRFDISKLEKPQVEFFTHDQKNPYSISNGRIMALLIDQKGRLIVGTENNGISIYTPSENKFYRYASTETKPGNLNSNSINDIYQDHSGNYWVGAYSGGINFARKNNHSIVSYNKQGTDNGLSNNSVTGFLKDNSGTVWITTDGGGVNAFDPQLGTFKTYNTKNSNNILTIFQDQKNRIWIGSWAGGLSSFSPKSGRFVSYHKANSLGTADHIFTIAEYNDEIWLGTFQEGLFRFHPENNSYKQYSTNNSLLAHDDINVLRFDSEGKLFIGTNYGLSIFDTKNEYMETFQEKTDSSNGMINLTINDILIENKNSVWIATQKGLNHFNPTEKIFTYFSETHGLPDNAIKGLLLDSEGELWITTTNGLAKMDVNNNKIEKTYTVEDGLQGNEFNNKSVSHLSNGKFIFGGTNGFSIIDKKELIPNNTKPEILITDLHIFNEPVEVGTEGSPLQVNITELDELVLTYEHSVITLFFNVMDFTIPKKNQYAYMMENFDPDWIYSGNRREATYTNLDPGEYTFKAIGANNDGIWNEAGTSLKIVILPPWWQTLWFRTLSATFVLLLASAIIFLRINGLKKQKNQLKKMVAMRTATIEEQNKKIQNQYNIVQEQAEKLQQSNTELKELQKLKDNLTGMIVHDLKNPLNRLMSVSSDANVAKKMDIISKISKNMLTMVMNILDVTKYDSSEVKLNLEDCKINDITNTAIDEVMYLCKEKNIELEYNRNEKVYVSCDREIIQRTLMNLLTNAIKFTPVGGKIKINQILDGKNLIMQVCDTGIGIPEGKRDIIFKPFGQLVEIKSGGTRSTGLGLAFCKIAIDAHQGEIGFESKEEEGTIFWFRLPVSSIGEIDKNEEIKQIVSDQLQIKINPQSIEKLNPYLSSLKALDVYEVSEIRKIIKQINDLNDPDVATWSNGLKQAVMSGDEKKYTELISLIKII